MSPPSSGWTVSEFISLNWRRKRYILSSSDFSLVWLTLVMLLTLWRYQCPPQSAFSWLFFMPQNIKKKSCQMHECLELWHFWKKQRLKIITCMRLESKWYITLQHFHIIATSRPLGFMWNTFHTWVASLYVREGVDPRLICSLAAKRERKS